MKYLSIILLAPFTLLSQEILVQPYLQNTSPNSITIMWEINQNEAGHIEWGISEELGNTTNAISESSALGNYIFTTELVNLTQNTKYYYRSANGNTYSELYSFYTEEIVNNEASTKIIAMSDMQMDNNFPNKFYQIIHDGILTYVEDYLEGDLNYNIDLILIPGDLVSNGNSYDQWQDDFF